VGQWCDPILQLSLSVLVALPLQSKESIVARRYTVEGWDATLLGAFRFTHEAGVRAAAYGSEPFVASSVAGSAGSVWVT
jgi:hypothetical protein